MKHKIFTLSLLLLIVTVFPSAKANPVGLRTAHEAAVKFMNANTNSPLRGVDDLQLVTTYSINRGNAAFYVFNTPNGFVIVSADDCATPILGYSDEGQFDSENIPVQMDEYLQGFVEQIQYGIENHIVADESTAQQWEMVLTTGCLNGSRTNNAVEPLLTERWDQGCYYNAMCPEDGQGPCGHTYVGCAAAAMGQIMHYWSYPETGGGSHSYTPSGYPMQSVNFWETTYDWGHMPDELSSSSSNTEVYAVATLLWHCGVSINMMYGHNGSGAYPHAVPAALTEYFNYSSDLYSQNKGDDASWLNQVKSSLDLGRPIHYSGWNGAGGGGHSFVCDGYDSNNQLHFNWGWSGNGNGYFALNALIVSSSNFSYNNYAIFNIHPHEGTETYTITTQSNPAEGGTTTGDGNYNYAHTCTLTANQNENYLFVNWTKNGYQVSSEPTCHVTVREDATYVANFRRTNIDEIVIGEATHSSDHLPLTSSNRHSLSQQIYTAREINANGPITDISFYHTGASTGNAPLNINLYLKHTQKSSFTSGSDWETLSPNDLCYSGSYLIDGTSGWKQISLETPFNYNGSDNLLVCIDNNTGASLSNLTWATFESNANLSLTAYGDTLNYNPFSPIGGIIGSFRNQIALTFQVTQGTDFVVTPDPINLGYRPSGYWMRPVSIGLYNSGMTTTISNISSSNSFFTLDTQNIEFPLIFEYHDQAEIQLSTGTGNGLIDASLNISYGNGQTKQTQLFATAYTPTVTDVWETAQEITTFPFSANLSNSFLPLYDNYHLPNTNIPDGPDAVYKITLDEETILNASVTNGENGKVALYTENFRGLDGPDTDNSFDSNNPINEWLYYVQVGSNLYHVSSSGNIHWGIMFPVSKLQPYLYTWLTKVALYETPNNMQSITLNIYLGGDSAPGTLVLTQDFIPLSNGIHEIDLNSEILIDGTQNLWITFNQKGDAAPASYAPITTDPNSHWLSSNGITWDNNNSGISFPIQGFFTNAMGSTLCMGNSNPRDVNQMDLMPGTYYLVASSTSDNWDLEINTQPIIGPIPASNPNPTHQSSGTDYVETQLSWTLGEGTTEYKVLFGKTPNCEQVLVTWTSDLANSYTFTTDLDWNTTYYWKVCERNSNCPNGISSPLWSFTTGNFVPREREIIASCYPSAGGAVSGGGIYTDGSTCTLTASPYSGYIFKRWADEDGRTISTNNSYSFVVHGNQNLIAIFAHTGNIPFADNNLKARCVAQWDANGDGELSYSEAANVTNIGNVFQNKRDFTSFDELQYFTALTSIGYWAFLGCQTMTSITIPLFVSNIANESFYAEFALGSISVVEENTHYDSRENCNAIIDTRTNQLVVGCKNTVVPNTVISIGYMAFGYCKDLTSINLPNSIQSIGANAFESCINLGSITLPNSLISIGNEAFVACHALSSVTIPSSVTQIGLNPFNQCNSFAHISVELGNANYDSRDNCNAIIETNTNQLICGTPNTVIPNTVTSIAERAFDGCHNLVSITIPRNVTSIGDFAFTSSYNLRSINILAETPPTLGADPFQFLDKNLIAIHVPCGLTSTYQSASGWSEFPIFQERNPYYLTATTANPNMGDAVVVHFPDCSDNTARVLATPYAGCTFVNWTSDGIEVSTSADYEFSLESDISLLANFTSNVDWNDPIVFADANVKAICVTHWDTNGDGELSYNEAMAVADIGSIFKGNTSITSFEELEYFRNLAQIGNEAFSGCSSLATIKIPANVTVIRQLAFMNCQKLNISLSEHLTTIEWGAFAGCSHLNSITIPASVTSIERQAFAFCNDLQSVTVFASTPPSVVDNTFQSVSTSISVFVPCNAVGAYSAISWGGFSTFVGMCPGVITVTANPTEGGTVTGGGSFEGGASCTVTATPNENYFFTYWTSNGNIVSFETEYTFFVLGDLNLTANFELNDIITFADANVKAICVSNWDTNGDGELSRNEAAAVRELGNAFSGMNQQIDINISSFDELRYFTGLTTLSLDNISCCPVLTSIILPNSITTIQGHAFYNCPNLTSITIPSSVSSIEPIPFGYCNGIEQIIVAAGNETYDSRNSCNAIIETESNVLIVGCKNSVIPETVVAIGPRAFEECQELSSIIIPNSVISIMNKAFCNCRSLSSVVFPSSVTTIGDGVFSMCYGLVSINIPNSLTSIGEGAFYACRNIEEISVEAGNPVYDSRNNCNAIVETSTNTLLVGCKNTVIPNSVTSIGKSAFYGCEFTTFVIPSSIISIGRMAFSSCFNLSSLTVLAETPPTIGNRISYFGSVSSSINIYIPCGTIDAYNSATGWEEFLNYQEILPYNFSVTSADDTMGTVTVLQEPGCETYAIIQALPNAGHAFQSWKKDGVTVSTDPTYSFTLTENSHYTAFFIIQEGAAYITATANPANGGTITGAGSYNQGTICTLTAIPNEGYAFARWKEGNETVSTDRVYTFQVTGNRNLVADFSIVGNVPGILNGVFSTSGNSQVRFSQGNLQYCAFTDTWSFADNQLDCAGNNNSSISSSYNGWVDLFGWGTSGYNHGAICYQPWSTSLSNSSYYAYGNSLLNLYDSDGKADWGYNAISNGGNMENIGWRTPTTDEWDYIFNYRTTASGIRYAKAKVNNVCGILLFPDNWDASFFTINSPNNGSISYNNNTITASQWSVLEQQGLVFLPASGWRGGSSTNEVNGLGNYWSSSACTNSNYAYVVYFNNSRLGLQETSHDRKYGRSVRLVYSFQAATSYFIEATPNPNEGGTITGAGTYNHGDTCALTATANEGYSFINWTEDGEVVSTETTYSFTVTGDRNLVANFEETGDDYYWDVDLNAYPNTMSIVAILTINDEEQFRTDLEVGVFCGVECRGTQRPSDEWYAYLNHYFLFLSVNGNDDDALTFRVYDHSLNQELELNCLTTATFVTNETLGDPGEPFVIAFSSNIEITQTSDFNTGWNWWSSFVEADDLMAQLKTGLGADGKQIKSQTKFTMNYGSMWMGQLNSIENEQTYMVQALAPCSVDVTGFAVNPADYPITLNTGWKWIGFPSAETLTVTEALAGLTPTAGDQIKMQGSFSTYYNNIGWMGTLKNLTPGKGYMFKLNGASQTLVFPSASRASVVEENITADGNHWVPDIYAYPSNMTVMAVVELDDVELASEQYELAAFANGKVRGSTKLMYVEGLNRWMAFLTIAGDEAAELRFGLHDGLTDTECFDSGDVLVYAPDAIVGSPDEPMVVRFRGTTGMDEWTSQVQVFPNPVESGQNIRLNLPDEGKVQVEIVNELGVETRRATSVQSPASIEAPSVPGVYTLRITAEGKGTCYRKLIVR